jgi:hypothetical protein
VLKQTQSNNGVRTATPFDFKYLKTYSKFLRRQVDVRNGGVNRTAQALLVAGVAASQFQAFRRREIEISQ